VKGDAKGKRANLVVKVSSDLTSQIAQGEFAVGDKLPSESQLVNRYSVSRTVVREAIASLRSGGIVETHQGAGAFVAQLPGAGDRGGFRPVDLKKISSVIEALEMRLAVESEAAALAAERRSPVQAARIMEALDSIRIDVEAGRSPSKSDFGFHMAIADAANNSRFAEFLHLMEAAISPRSQLDGPMAEPQRDRAHFETLFNEHKKIADAIYKRDSELARKAMHAHISGTLNRYAEMLTS